MSLYTKYRPKDWDSVVGQDLVTTILRESLKSKQTGHAYIFTGSRGTGKTTSARIFAKSLNCTALQNGNPCHQCENCIAFDSGNMLDVVEIDAASNTGVENVRDLIEKAKFAPTQGEYKIYIIDEVHMLSTGAFNALLKTLEEPPLHVKFILATTDIHKVPETIRSRAQRFDFRKITEQNLIARLDFVAKQEKIETENGTLELIAKMARGGMRDALTLLEQYTINSKLSLEYLQNSLSVIDENFLNKIISDIFEKNFTNTRENIEKIKSTNIRGENFFDQIILSLRDKMVENLENEDFTKYDAIFQIFRSAYSSLRSIENTLLIEITLLEAVNYSMTNGEKIIIQEKIITKIAPSGGDDASTKQSGELDGVGVKKIENFATNLPPLPEKLTEEKIVLPPKIENIPEEKPLPQAKNTNTAPTQAFSFIKLLNDLKTTAPAVSATLKNAQFRVNETHLFLTFTSNFTANRINQEDYKNAIISSLDKLFGGSWTLETATSKAKPITDDMIDDVF